MEHKNISDKKRIMMSGGGTGGSVTPLLAVAEELLSGAGAGSLEMFFVGTARGPEKEMVADFNKEVGREALKFYSIAGGKLRRYFSFRNILDIFKVIVAFFQSIFLLGRVKPDIVISAGAFVSVPLVWAAAIRKIPVLIHQQDLRPGLANKLMAPWARAITVVFEKSLVDYGPRAILAGNPMRRAQNVIDDGLIDNLKDKYSLADSKPFVLVFGGGLGANGINQLVFKAADKLAKECTIIHLTGKGKLPEDDSLRQIAGYHVLENTDNRGLSAMISLADLVVSRAGLGALTELSYWRKPAILIPMPDSHQEDNADYFARLGAAVVKRQSGLAAEELVGEINSILGNERLKESLSNNIGKIMRRDAVDTIAGIIWEIIGGR